MEYVEPNLVKLSGSDFHLEEAWQDIRGFDAYDVDGDKIGTVKDFYIDREAHVTRFLDGGRGLPRGRKEALPDPGGGGYSQRGRGGRPGDGEPPPGHGAGFPGLRS